jgi:CHAD domain-containing protein
VSVPTTKQFATAQAGKLLRSLTLRVNRTLRSPGIEEVHDLRAAIRRFLRVLVVLKPCFPQGESRRIRRGLKRILMQAGSVRDHDIALRLLAKTELSESAASVQRLRERREEGARTLSASLQRWTLRRLPAAWRKAGESDKPRKGADGRFCNAPIAATARRILPAMAMEYFRAGKDAAHGDASVGEIHRFRIDTRNFRYTLELFASLYGDSLAGLLRQVKDVQAVLGDVHDYATVRRMLSRHKAERPDEGGEAVRKEILSGLKKKQRKKAEQFRHHYAAAFAGATDLRSWKDSLRHPGTRV